MAAERIEREHLDGRVAVAPGVVEQRGEALARARHPVGGVERRQQAVAERGLLAAAGVAVPRGRRLERGARLGGLSSARSTRPRCTRPSAARRTSPVASALAIPSSSVAAPVA